LEAGGNDEQSENREAQKPKGGLKRKELITAALFRKSAGGGS
jgi:hypothetical protein